MMEGSMLSLKLLQSCLEMNDMLSCRVLQVIELFLVGVPLRCREGLGWGCVYAVVLASSVMV